MPIYEYACTNCGERTEAKQSFTDPPLEECPHCGGKLRKLYSPVGIVFKGSGFYSTDAKKKASSGSSAAKESTSNESTAKESSKDTSSKDKPSSKTDSSGSSPTTEKSA